MLTLARPTNVEMAQVDSSICFLLPVPVRGSDGLEQLQGRRSLPPPIPAWVPISTGVIDDIAVLPIRLLLR